MLLVAQRGAVDHFFGPHHMRRVENSAGEGALPTDKDLEFKIKGNAPANSTIGIVATDAALTKSQMKRIAIMAQDGYHFHCDQHTRQWTATSSLQPRQVEASEWQI